MQKLPQYSDDLIDDLLKEYSRRPLDINASEREIWFTEGQAALVEMLVALKNRKKPRSSQAANEESEDV